MNRLFLTFGFCFALSAHADDIRVVELNNNDSVRFTEVLSQLSFATSIPDPQNAAVWFRNRKFVSENGALTLACSTKFNSGLDLGTKCSIEFNLTKSTKELEVFEGKIGGALGANINTQDLATKVSRATGHVSFVSLEKINVTLPSGKAVPYPRIRIDFEKGSTHNVAQRCTLVAVPNQTN